MKKITLILTIALVLLLLTACGSAPKATQTVPSEPTEDIGALITIPKETADNTGSLITAAPNTDTSVSVPTDAAKEAAPDEDTLAYYIDVVYPEQIGRYYRALQEQWEEGKYYEQEMSALAAYYYDGNPTANVGFGFEDLDRDGSLELIIGAIANKDLDPAIFEIWTLRNGVPTMLCQSGYRNRYYLEYQQDDNSWLIANEGSGSAFNSATHYYYLEKEQMHVVLGIVLDASVDEANPWFMAYDDDWNAANDTPIDEATAANITAAHRAGYTVPEYIPYSLY